MVAKRAGQFAGGFFNNPGVVAAIGIVSAIGLSLLFFQNDIRKFFAGISEGFGEINIQLPEIKFPEFPEIKFPEFPAFPEFPMFPSFEDIFGPPQPGEIIDGELVPGEIPGDGLGPVEIPEGCTITPEGVVNCPSPPTFDVCNIFPELCDGDVPEEGDPDFIGPVQPEEPFRLPSTEIITEQPIDVLQLPEGFEGGGVSFEGGTIFETPIENLSLSQIIDRFGVTASQAADILARAGGGTPEAIEQFEAFDFGTSTGSGFGPGEDPLTTPLVTGGATLESEEQRAACTSCELFGLNCPICAGESGA